MLKITITPLELWDEENQTFIYRSEKTFSFEYSLKAIAEWESQWEQPFFTSKLTQAQQVSLYKCMCIGDELDDLYITPDLTYAISDYMVRKNTATVIKDEKSTKQRRILTSEVVYSYMAAAQVPFTCEDWNINRLMTLLGVISVNQNGKEKKMSKTEVMKQNAELNAERKKKYNTKG